MLIMLNFVLYLGVCAGSIEKNLAEVYTILPRLTQQILEKFVRLVLCASS